MSEQSEPDVIDKALGAFDHVLDIFHDRVLRPIFIAGRAIAFGFIVLMMTLVLVIAGVVGLIRLFNVYLFAGHEWASYAISGLLLLGVGLRIWRRRRPLPLRK